MRQDITNQYIAQILAHCQIDGKNVLEIGCGTGRITSNLVDHARHVMAIDPDGIALTVARQSIYATNVKFIQTDLSWPSFPPESFDVAIFSLSLHHIPIDSMLSSIKHVAGLVSPDGVIAVIEPADGGALTFAKETFGAGSGDERKVRAAVLKTLRSNPVWKPSLTIPFDVMWHFNNQADFFDSMLPNWRSLAKSTFAEIQTFLARHTTDEGIILDAARQLILLRQGEME